MSQGNIATVDVRILALGASVPGTWGAPRATLLCAIDALAQAGISTVCTSGVYSTTPVGPGLQQPYHNMAIVVKTALPPAGLLRVAKRVERDAGRGLPAFMRGRSLDIDLLDYGGRRIGWRPRRRLRGGLILPHPELHKRAFALIPLLEIVPAWRHPALGVAGRTLLARLTPSQRAGVRRSP